MNQRAALPSPLARGFGSPDAPPVLTHVRTGPKEALSDLVGSCRQVWTSPMNEIFGVARVLPIGVLQQPAYQRSNPLGVSRMQAKDSVPCENVMFLGRT